jgi:plasmid stabilization system protein ParE
MVTAQAWPCGIAGAPKEDGAMPQKAWSDKRERQYEHIKDSYEERGVNEDEAEERAARTVNKERREAGETKEQREGRGE